jgi:hypothetical protein
MERLMARAAAGDEGDLAAPRAAGPGDEDGALVQSDDVGMGRGEATQALGQQRLGRVHEFLHGSPPKGQCIFY